MTPEGKVKSEVKKLLDRPGCWYFMPVQNGMGKPSLDFIGCYWGVFFAIETKAPGKKPTPRQCLTIKKMAEARGQTFVVDSEESLAHLNDWLISVQMGGADAAT